MRYLLPLSVLVFSVIGVAAQGQKPGAKKVDKGTGVFAKMLERRGVRRSSSNVSIAPTTDQARFRILNSVNGERPVLSISVEIRNASRRPIVTELSHEWYGGLPPPTDLYAAALKKGASGPVWHEGPAYQVGDLDAVDKTVIPARESKTVDVRLNWPGTGSVDVPPLIGTMDRGIFPLRFVLLFRSNGVQRYAESKTVPVQVSGYKNLVEVEFAGDDKAEDKFHTIHIFWISRTASGFTRRIFNWATQGGHRPEPDAAAKARQCALLLNGLMTPKDLPKELSKRLTVRWLVDESLRSEKFPIDHVPGEIHQVLMIMGIREEVLTRLTFVPR